MVRRWRGEPGATGHIARGLMIVLAGGVALLTLRWLSEQPNQGSGPSLGLVIWVSVVALVTLGFARRLRTGLNLLVRRRGELPKQHASLHAKPEALPRRW